MLLGGAVCFSASFSGRVCACVVTVCIWVPMVRMTCVSVGATWSGKHWSWPPRKLGVLVSFWVASCFGGDAVFCRVLLVFGGVVHGVESLFRGVRYICLAFLEAMAGQLFFWHEVYVRSGVSHVCLRRRTDCGMVVLWLSSYAGVCATF